MDKATLIGLTVAIIGVFVGMVLKGVDLSVLINAPAILIIIFGTFGSVMIAFPMNEIKKVPKLLGIIFKDRPLIEETVLIKMFSEWAQIARKEGLLALEAKTQEIEDEFLKNGLSMAVDGQNADYIRDVLSEEIEEMVERHKVGAQIFTQAGTYAPTLGVLGAVVGLIAALADMSDIDALGYAISAAFVATLLGIFTGYVLWHPFANKLRRKSEQEANLKYMMVEGVLSILEGEAPRVIEQKLASFLPAGEKKRFLEEGDVTRNE